MENATTKGLQTIWGIPIHINDLVGMRPVREVKLRRWHRRRCYATRVNKKWRAKYGMEPRKLLRDGRILEIHMPVFGDRARRVLMMNSTTYQQMKCALTGVI